MQEFDSKICKILATITRRDQREILGACKNAGAISDIAIATGRSQTTVTKQIQRLVKAGLVEKSSDKAYSLTPMGKILSLNIPTASFLEKNREFFRTHWVGYLPPRFAVRLGDLSNCKHTTQITHAFPRWKNLIKQAKSYLYCIFTEPPILVEDLMKEKIEQGIEIKFLFGKNNKIYFGSEFVRVLELDKPKSYKNVEKRITDKIVTNLMVSEKSACLAFPSLKGTADLHNNFFSSKPEFRQWCLDFFSYRWKKSSPITRLG